MESSKDDKYGRSNQSNVIELAETDFNSQNKIIRPEFKNKFSLIKVYAPWCTYCVKMTNDINFLANHLPKENIMVGAINYEKNKELVSNLNVKTFPSMFIANIDGTLENVNMGSRSVEEILNVICIKTKEYSMNTCCRITANGIKC